MKKLTLIPHWREAWRYVSVQLGALAVFLQTLLTTYPTAAMDAWQALPLDMKAFIPPNYLQLINCLLMGGAVLARIVSQPKTQEKIAVKEAVKAAELANENTASQSSTLPLTVISALLLLGAVSNNVYAGEATVVCTKPTTNKDGTPYTNHAGFRYLWGPAADDLTGTTYVDGPTLPCSYTIKNLVNGTWYFAVRAYNVESIESPNSNTVTKVISNLPPPAPPIAPTATVKATEVFQVVGTLDAFQLLPVGTVPPDTVCIPTQTINGYYGVPNSKVVWYGNVRPKIVVAKCD